MDTRYIKSTLVTAAALISLTASAAETYTLPFEFEPSSATFQECVVIDANEDGKGTYGQWTVNDGAFRYTYSETKAADDWIILPMVNFGESKKATVSLDVKAGGYDENFKVMLGQERNVESMTITVMTETYKSGSSWKTFSAEVEIPDTDTNEWALGIYACSAANMNTLDIKNIRIEGENSEVNPPVSENYALPFKFTATQETFDQCINIDANGDKNPNDTMGYNNGIWSYAMAYGGAFKYTYSMSHDADDWLILPFVDFGDAENVVVSVDVRTDSDPESFEIYLGKERTVDGMTLEVLKRADYTNRANWETLTAEISLKNDLRELDNSDNKWCIGIHATSPANHYNLYVNNISIKSNPSAGVENITETTDGEAKYYTLQGVRIAEPQNGQFVIMCINGKAEKLMYKGE